MKLFFTGAIAVFFITAAFGDEIYLKDGSIIKGRNIKITDTQVEYNSEGSSEQKTLPRKEISRVEYSDGRVVYIVERKLNKLEKKEAQEDKESQAPLEAKFEPKTPTGGFHDSYVRIAGFFGFGNPTGGVFERERRVFNAFKPDLYNAYLIPRDYNMTHNLAGGGGDVDIMPPAIKFVQRRAFDFTGIKFGIRGRYGYESVDSIVTEESYYYDSVENYELFRGRYMGYHYWAAGPVINLIFSPRSNLMNLILNFYVVAGQIFKGDLLPAAALRSSRVLAAELAGAFVGPFSRSFIPPEYAIFSWKQANKTRFNGYTIRGGFGPHFSLNKYCPITIGLNVTYAYSNLRLGRSPFIYLDGNRKATHHEVGAEISAGFHL